MKTALYRIFVQFKENYSHIIRVENVLNKAANELPLKQQLHVSILTAIEVTGSRNEKSAPDCLSSSRKEAFKEKWKDQY